MDHDSHRLFNFSRIKNLNLTLKSVPAQCCSAFLILALVWNGCRNNKEPGLSTNTLDSLTLAKKHCGSCHRFPGPDLLDKKTWDKTLLPNMGCRLGIQTDGYNPYAGRDMMEQSLLQQANIYPERPLIPDSDWLKIKSYYISNAPDALKTHRDSSVDLVQFTVHPKGSLVPGPRITLLSVDHFSGLVYAGMESGQIRVFDPSWRVTDSFTLAATPIQHIPGGDQSHILSVGNLYPSEQSFGAVLSGQGRTWKEEITGLHRPVWLSLMDLDGDHEPDYILHEFGYETGRLSWYPSSHRDHNSIALYSGPGSIKSEAIDLDGDGRQEMVSLIAQGDEHVSVWLPSSKGPPEEKRILSFPPVYGVCDMDLIDFNLDGKVDILISNGDNADYSQVPKPYHGIHVFQNQGGFLFEEARFIPYPGVLHCEAADFDLDGDVDLAAISFFPGDKDNPHAAFKYFRQEGDGNFTSFRFRDGNHGKWMTMARADLDRDGDEDILLGSFILTTDGVTGSREDMKKYALVYLENRGDR